MSDLLDQLNGLVVTAPNERLANIVRDAIAEIRKSREQLVRATDLVRTLVENDPDEPIADNGAVVLDLWRQQARAFLGDEHAN